MDYKYSCFFPLLFPYTCLWVVATGLRTTHHHSGAMKTCGVLVFLTMITWRCCLGQDCPLFYLRSSTDHTFCRPPNSNCTILANGVSEEDKNIIVDTHNSLRNIVATGNENRSSLPPSTNQMQMVWDDELASIAEKQAEQCMFEHDCNACRAVDNFPVGQNLRQEMLTSTAVPVANWQQAINDWNNEVQYFSAYWISPFWRSGDYSRFTQIQWATTWRVGCGFAVFETSDTYYTNRALYICNYGPVGNILGGEMYNVGDTCSQCPPNTCCGEQCTQVGVTVDYDGLCKSIDDRGPQPPPPPPSTLLYCDFSNDTEDCEVEVTGTNRWQINKVLSGNYTTTTISAGETTELKFPLSRPATYQYLICVSFSYRKGPSIAVQVSDNDFQVHLNIPNLPWNYTYTIIQDTNDWILYRILEGVSYSTQVFFTYSAGIGAPDQYLDIKNVLIAEGNC